MARGTTFNDSVILEEMLARRMAGATVSELGRAYGVDHTTIIYQCKKHGVGYKRELETEKIRRKARTATVPQAVKKTITLHPILERERINRGLPSYAAYLAEAKLRDRQRKWEERYAH